MFLSQKLVELSRQMEAAVLRLDTTTLLSLENERHVLISRFPTNLETLSSSERSRLADDIRLIQNFDHEVRKRIDPWLEHISTLLSQFSANSA